MRRLIAFILLTVFVVGCEVVPSEPIPVPTPPVVVVPAPEPTPTPVPVAPPVPAPKVPSAGELAYATLLLQALAVEYKVSMEPSDPWIAVDKALNLSVYASASNPIKAVVEAEFRPQYERRGR